MIDMLKYTFVELKGEVRQVYFILLTQPGWFSVLVLLYSVFWRPTVGFLVHSVSLAVAVMAIFINQIAEMVAPKIPGHWLPDPEAFIMEANAFIDKSQDKYNAIRDKAEKDMR